ncbi:amidase [Micractinium conductrix]|uniref:Amidase n=1 Tax=Micractinium conductrix TaxID=554055 RepID=A0A2P6VL48_9CHLO|nr:amidase [Micractinium conductrix]|eukprot:PSC74805.1 amidase [Micractinium conductrix]
MEGCRGWADQSAVLAGAAAAEGPLAGLAFAAKDCFDVAGQRTGLGNPSWRRDHPPAQATAPAVQALLAAGANLAGRAAMSELAYDFSGSNCFYGTPVNPAAPGRVPGGSSSGCAALVASGEVAFALGGDTAGSVRVPASFCGVFGCRPSHGRISNEGVTPLAPSFDTVGWFARDATLLRAVGRALLPREGGRLVEDGWQLLLAQDALSLCDAAVAEHFTSSLLEAHGAALAKAAGSGAGVQSVTLADASTGELASWADAFAALHSKEVWQTLGTWYQGPTQPVVSAPIAHRLKAASQVTEAQAAAAAQHAESIATRLESLLGERSVLLLPATAFPAPPVGADLEGDGSSVHRLLALNSIASLAGLPQVCLPLLTLPGGLPLGVSLIGPRGSDEALLALAEAATLAVTRGAAAAANGVHFTPSVCFDMLPPGLDDPKVWRLRFICQSTLAPGYTMADHARHLPEHHAFLADLQARGVLQFMGPFLTMEADDCGDGMFCLRANSLAEAREMVASNPFHRRGIRVATVRPWLEKILE